MPIARRLMILGSLSALGGCSAVSALNSAATPLDTYDLTPAPGSTSGRSTRRSLVVARPDAPAAIATDRIMVKPGGAAITYLPDARWADELPLVLQSLLIRSISDTGRLGYVGRSEGGPVPDTALLVRVDGFQVNAGAAITVAVDITLSLLDDREQTVIASRGFAQTAPAPNDTPAAIVAAFQAVLDALLPAMADWAVARA